MSQFFIYSRHAPGKVLDVREGNRSNGARLQLWSFNGGDNQKFTFDQASGSIRAVVSGLSLDMDRYPNPGGYLQCWSHHGGANQQFEIVGEQIKMRGQNLVFDVHNGGTHDGAEVILHNAHGGSNQHWQFVPVGAPGFGAPGGGFGAPAFGAPAPGFGAPGGGYGAPAFSAGIPYFIYSKHAPGKVLDLREGSRNNGARIQIWSFLGGDNQKFTIDPASGAIRPLVSGLSLDMDKYPNPGGHLQQWAHHGGPNQQFEIVGDQIKLRGQNLVVDIHNGGTHDGAEVILHNNHGGSNQRWQLAPANAPTMY